MESAQHREGNRQRVERKAVGITVAKHAPGRDLLRKELAQFFFKPGSRGQLRLEAARGHDDLVIAAALAVLAADLAAFYVASDTKAVRR